MEKKIIAVVGATGLQGKGVVSALYMGPNSDAQIQMAEEISTEPFATLDAWTKLNMN
jgi:hypothetical protein